MVASVKLGPNCYLKMCWSCTDPFAVLIAVHVIYQSYKCSMGWVNAKKSTMFVLYLCVHVIIICGESQLSVFVHMYSYPQNLCGGEGGGNPNFTMMEEQKYCGCYDRQTTYLLIGYLNNWHSDSYNSQCSGILIGL